MDVCLLILSSILKCNNLVFHFKKFSNNNLVRATMQEHNPTFFPPFSPSFPIRPLVRAVHLGVVFGAVRFHAVHFRTEKCLFELRASPGRPSVHSLFWRKRMYIELPQTGQKPTKNHALSECTFNSTEWAKEPPEISRGRRVDEYTCEPHRVDSG